MMATGLKITRIPPGTITSPLRIELFNSRDEYVYVEDTSYWVEGTRTGETEEQKRSRLLNCWIT